MEKMRPQLEKLQKQYANDKQAYNAKMMELYRKNGYSMLGPCLPMIVTLVIFIFVMSAFSSYSGYMNLHTYEQMARRTTARSSPMPPIRRGIPIPKRSAPMTPIRRRTPIPRFTTMRPRLSASP